jgi:hypothetical protein
VAVGARANGKLQSTPQETVPTENQCGQTAIEIQPADPHVIYVPTDDPYYVWGPPDWGLYPPLFYPVYGYGFGPGIDIGLCFGGWGWGPNWFGHSGFVNYFFFNRHGYHHGLAGGFQGRTPWMHNPGKPVLIGELNRHLKGGMNSCSLGYPSSAYWEIERYVGDRLIQDLQRRSQRPYRPPQGEQWLRKRPVKAALTNGKEGDYSAAGS